jgi:glycosyltransferase involved in cell wall biosynthesis
MSLKPIVSVVMITYGHENYIHQAIEGVLMQQFDFEVELIIANDCSPDNTDEVVKNIISSNLTNIKIIYFKHEKNIGMMPNFIFALEKAKGKYIALCEGDDYWTDFHKLQKQVDFLEANSTYSACFTDVSLLNEEKLIPNALKEKHKKDSDAISIFYDTWIPTLTLFFRNSMLVKPLPKQFKKVNNGDLFLFYLLAQKGEIGYLDTITGVYRQHENGVWSGANKLQQLNKSMVSLKLMNSFFSYNEKINFILKERLLNTYWSKCKLHYNSKQYKNFSLTILQVFLKNPLFTLKKLLQ